MFGSVGRVGLYTAVAFTPMFLFASGEQGAWYDPSDFSTMFQDSAGTTPVTAVEQPVGLHLDKSKGLTLGSELVTNGDFSNGTTGWTAQANTTANVLSGELEVTNVGTGFGTVTQAITTVVGMAYVVNATVRRGTASNASMVARTAPTSGNIALVTTTSTENVPLRLQFTATSTTTYIVCANNNTNNGTAYYDNISVRELPGNHASQSTTTSRPVLSARVNLLTYTESFSNAAWVQAGSGTASAGVKTNNFGTAPDGTQTAMRVQLDVSAGSVGNQSQVYQIINVTSGVSYKYSAWIKTNDGTTKTIMAFSGGTTSPTSLTVNGTWTRYEALRTVGGATDAFQFILIKGTTSDTADLLVWHPDARAASEGVNLPAYQRVAAATDYDTTGFPLALRFDGVDDFLVTGTIDPGGVDKAQVFAGMRKLSGAATGVVAELSPTASNNGSTALFALVAPVASYRFNSRGTALSYVALSPDTFAAPITNVLTGLGDISGDLATLRVNGTQAAQSTSDQGTGNYLSYPLYIGRRGGTSFPYNGNLYSLIVRFSATNMAESTISQTETWVNGKTMAY